jgi:hypothetical protein
VANRDEHGRPFYPRSLDRGVRNERAMTLAVAEMYVQGVSTRKVTAVVQNLRDLDTTSTQVSQAAAELDEQFGAWRNRPIGEIIYLVLDARYEKVRHDGAIVPCALLKAISIGPDGKRSILGCSVQLSEAETHWRSFLQSLVDRGMRGIKLVVSDDHAGLKAARQAVLAGVSWQRGQFSISCRTPWPICRRLPCERRSPPSSAASSTRMSLRRPSGGFGRSLPVTRSPLPNSPPGSKRASRKSSPSCGDPLPPGGGSERPTGSSGSTRR